jgi:hypothetical protein
MSSIVDLDSDTCSSDVLEAVRYVKTTFKISRSNPYFLDVMKMNVEVIKDDGEQVYFRIKPSG